MPRQGRIVVPGYPHHIVQRGNRCQPVFFSDSDRQTYLDYLVEYAKPAGIDIWAYCLMDNHVHFVAVPQQEDSFSKGLSQVHVRYTRMINFQKDWRGYLWQGRFYSCVLDEKHLYGAMRYVELNPVRAGIVSKPHAYRWSSALAHTQKTKDQVVGDNFVVRDTSDWAAFLSQGDNSDELTLFRRHTTAGRPLGDNAFAALVEKIVAKTL